MHAHSYDGRTDRRHARTAGSRDHERERPEHEHERPRVHEHGPDGVDAGGVA